MLAIILIVSLARNVDCSFGVFLDWLSVEKKELIFECWRCSILKPGFISNLQSCRYFNGLWYLYVVRHRNYDLVPSHAIQKKLLANTRLFWNLQIRGYFGSFGLIAATDAAVLISKVTGNRYQAFFFWVVFLIASEKTWWLAITLTCSSFPHVIVPLRNSMISTAGTGEGSTETSRAWD